MKNKMNFKYRVCGTQIEKLQVLRETAHMITYIRPAGANKPIPHKERKTSTFQNWFDKREDAITAAECEVSLAQERATRAVDAAREKSVNLIF